MGQRSLKLLISGEVLLNGGGGRSENKINTNKWGWDGQLGLAISKNKFVKTIAKTSTKHNNIFLKYAIRQSFKGKPIIHNYKFTLFTQSMQIISNSSFYFFTNSPNAFFSSREYFPLSARINFLLLSDILAATYTVLLYQFYFQILFLTVIFIKLEEIYWTYAVNLIFEKHHW